MHPTLSRLPPLHLDAKRIVATSAAIAVHVLALMLLMLPVQSPPSRMLEETTMIVVPEFRTLPPIPMPRPLAPVTAVPPAPRPTATPQATPVDSTPAPVDPYLPEGPADDVAGDDFAPPALPAFAQISADVAPAPPYPALALRRHLSGVVMLRLRVGVDGQPLAAAIETSSGSRLLDEAALKFVLARWHFIPATQDGHAIEAEALVPISFVIDR
jgi:protein TonB